ncbi:MIF4G domain-containing protein [Entamoeba marina]
MTLYCKYPLYIDRIQIRADVNCVTQTAKTRVKVVIKSMYSADQSFDPVNKLAFVLVTPSLNGVISNVGVEYLEHSIIRPSCYATTSANVRGLSKEHVGLIRGKQTKNATPGYILAGAIEKYDSYSNIAITFTIEHGLVHLPTNNTTLYSIGRDLLRETRSIEMEMEIESKERIGNINTTLAMVASFNCKKEGMIYKTHFERFETASQSDTEIFKKKDMNIYISTDTSGDYISRYDNGIYFQMDINKKLTCYKDKYLSIVVDLTLPKDELEWCKAYLVGLLILCETRNALEGFNIYTIQSTSTSFELFQLNPKYYKRPTHEDFRSGYEFIQSLQPSFIGVSHDIVISQFTPFHETTDVVLATQSKSTKLYSSDSFKTHYLFCGESLNLYSAWQLNGLHQYFDLVGPNRLSDMERGIWGLFGAMTSQRLTLLSLDIEFEQFEETLDILEIGREIDIPSFTYTDGEMIRMFFPTQKKVKVPLNVKALFRNEEFGTEVSDSRLITTELEHEKPHSFILEFNQLRSMKSKEIYVKTTENRVATPYSILDSSPLISCYYSNLQISTLQFTTPIASLLLNTASTPIDCPLNEPGDFEPDEKIKHFITSSLNKLSAITFAGVVTDLLTIDYSNSCVITYLAKTIINKASRDLKYIPYYADLSISLSLFISSTFTQVMLNILSVEFSVRNTSKADLLERSPSLSEQVIQRILSQSHIRFSAIIRFIGHLNLRGFFPSPFMVTAIRDLLKDNTSQSFEYLNLLIKIIGEVWDQSNDLRFMIEEVFETIDFTLRYPQKISSRVKFMLMDLVDLRKGGWNSQPGKPPSLAQPGESFDSNLATIDESNEVEKSEGLFVDDI